MADGNQKENTKEVASQEESRTAPLERSQEAAAKRAAELEATLK